MWFEIHYVYYEDEPVKTNLNYSSYLSIDLGVNNFTTCVPRDSTSGTPFNYEGRGLKSFNRWWNKEKAKLQSVYDKQGIRTGKKMSLLLRKRKELYKQFRQSGNELYS